MKYRISKSAIESARYVILMFLSYGPDKARRYSSICDGSPMGRKELTFLLESECDPSDPEMAMHVAAKRLAEEGVITITPVPDASGKFDYIMQKVERAEADKV